MGELVRARTIKMTSGPGIQVRQVTDVITEPELAGNVANLMDINQEKRGKRCNMVYRAWQWSSFVQQELWEKHSFSSQWGCKTVTKVRKRLYTSGRKEVAERIAEYIACLLYTSPSPRDA